MPADPYRYFRIEAHELVDALADGVLRLERGETDAEGMSDLFRQAHTLKGAARVVKLAAIAERAHAMEDLLAAIRDRGARPEADEISALFGHLDRIREGIGQLDVLEEPQAQPSAVPERTEIRFGAVRVEIADLDRLMDALDDTSVRVAALETVAADVAEVRRVLAGVEARALGGTSIDWKVDIEELRRLLEQLQRNLDVGLDDVHTRVRRAVRAAKDQRLVRVDTVVPALERAARDAAAALGREVRLESEGGEIRIDATVLSVLSDALVHLVQNAVVHGIEPLAERRAVGKPAAGRITLKIAHRGQRVRLTCADDGRGFDLGAIRASAEAAGHRVEETDDEAALRLAFQGGVSTVPEADALAGRGIGLEVVHRAALRLRGRVEIDSRPGEGSSIRLVVPVSLAMMTILQVRAEGRVVGLPLDAVRGALQVPVDELARSGEGTTLRWQDREVRFVPLRHVLGLRATHTVTRSWTAVVVRAQSTLVALGVDRLVGTQDAVVRPLPELAGRVPAVLGAAFDAEGDPEIVLDPTGLDELLQLGPPEERVVRARPAPVLVIDDSLTTRMLEQSILETAGYEVDLAASAEEGLEMARRRRYGLYVVDVEMPGMNGFEFVSTVRDDPELGRTPAILVTSRARAEDRLRGLEAGAKAYLVKSEFDQRRFLHLVRDLVGA